MPFLPRLGAGNILTVVCCWTAALQERNKHENSHMLIMRMMMTTTQCANHQQDGSRPDRDMDCRHLVDLDIDAAAGTRLPPSLPPSLSACACACGWVCLCVCLSVHALAVLLLASKFSLWAQVAVKAFPSIEASFLPEPSTRPRSQRRPTRKC